MKVTRREFSRLSLASMAVAKLPLATLSAENNADSINPLIGASTSKELGEGKTFPGPATPFGMVQLGPDTVTGGDNAPGYSYEHTTIEGFSYTRMSGVGWYGDFGNLMTMPMVGGFKAASGRPDHPGEGWRCRYDHSSEIAQCGYYAVTLADYGIRAELTAAPHAGILRFTFPKSNESRIHRSRPAYRRYIYAPIHKGRRRSCRGGMGPLSGTRRRLGQRRRSCQLHALLQNGVF